MKFKKNKEKSKLREEDVEVVPGSRKQSLLARVPSKIRTHSPL